MKKLIPLKILLFAVPVCVLTYHSQAQNNTSNNATENNGAITHAISLYHQFLFPETGLYNGRQYAEYTYTIQEGSPFFEAQAFANSSVVYDRATYENVPLLYDIVYDQLVVISPDFVNKISLNSDKVSSFIIDGHQFFRLTEDSLGKQPIRTGFYEQLYKGKTIVYKKQMKSIQETVSVSQGLRRYIETTNNYFINKDGQYYYANKKNDVLNIYKDHKKDISQFIKKNKLKLKKNIDEALIQIATYYDKISG